MESAGFVPRGVFSEFYIHKQYNIFNRDYKRVYTNEKNQTIKVVYLRSIISLRTGSLPSWVSFSVVSTRRFFHSILAETHKEFSTLMGF